MAPRPDRKGITTSKGIKIIGIFIILILLTPLAHASLGGLLQWFSSVFGPAVKNFISGRVEAIKNIMSWSGAKKLGCKIAHFLSDHHFHYVRTIGFFWVWYSTLTGVISDLSQNLTTYILMNPDPLRSDILSTTKFFITLIYPLYILAMIYLAVYVIFISASPTKRSRAKAMLVKLVIGMLLIPSSPHLLALFLDFSTEFTRLTIAQGEDEINAAIYQFEGTMSACYYLALAMVYGPDFLGILGEKILHRLPIDLAKKYEIYDELKGKTWGIKREYIKGGKVKIMVCPGSWYDIKAWKTVPGAFRVALHHIHIAGEPGQVMPLMMLFTLLVAAIYGILAFRFIILTMLTLIFPLSIFFLSFDPTKKLGNTLLEQTLLWTLMQEFYAITLIAIGVGLILLPENMAADYVLTLRGPWEAFGYVLPGITFFALASCLTLAFAPVVLFMMFKKLLPPF